MKEVIKRIPLLGSLAQRISRAFKAGGHTPEPFTGSAEYWEKRYQSGGNSGAGSYARFAEFKAEVLNEFVVRHGVQSVIELGCGDGNQLTLAHYPAYLGFDVSGTAIAQCQKLFKSDPRKSFRLMNAYNADKADLSMSLDVIYHLVEDSVFEQYMQTLFAAAHRYVIIYASDSDDNQGHDSAHVRHRRFTPWVKAHLPDWKLAQHIPNRYPYRGDYTTGSFADFFIYERL